MSESPKPDLMDVCAKMARRIRDYIEDCDRETLCELYKLCFGSDQLVNDFDESLE